MTSLARALVRPIRSGVPVAVMLALMAGCSKEAPPAQGVRSVRTVVVGQASAPEGHTYAAEIKARTETPLGFRVGGKVLTRPATLGASVRSGELLAELDAADLRLGEAAAQAALRSARSSFDLAQADLARYQSLRDQGFIGEAELQRRQATLKAARAALDQAQAQAGVQGHQTGYARLTADAAGVVTAVLVEPGAVVQAGTPVVRLARDGARDVVFSVPEDRQSALRPLVGRAGAVKVALWGDTDRRWPATVRELAGAADAASRTYLVKAELAPEAPGKLGQTATVTVPEEAPSPRAGIVVPLTAVHEHEGRSQVWVLDTATSKVQRRVVVLDGTDGGAARILSGLNAGEVVVTAGVHVLTPGQQVRRMPESPVSAPVAAASR